MNKDLIEEQLKELQDLHDKSIIDIIEARDLARELQDSGNIRYQLDQLHDLEGIPYY